MSQFENKITAFEKLLSQRTEDYEFANLKSLEQSNILYGSLDNFEDDLDRNETPYLETECAENVTMNYQQS